MADRLVLTSGVSGLSAIGGPRHVAEVLFAVFVVAALAVFGLGFRRRLRVEWFMLAASAVHLAFVPLDVLVHWRTPAPLYVASEPEVVVVIV